MLQRIQTLYLLAASVASVLLFFIPVTAGSGPVAATGPIAFPIMAGLFSCAALICIFLYGNRKLQLVLCRISTILMLALITMIFFFSGTAGDEAAVCYAPGIALPLFALVFTLLAWRAIRKDEALVRGTERLR